MTRIFYHILTYLAMPVLLLRVWLRGIRNPKHWQRWYERLGFYRKRLPQQAIWVHAVSLGEVNAITPLIKRLQQTYPNETIIISNTTLTGAEQVQKIFKESVTQCFLPMDYQGAVKRFLKTLQPKCGIVVETELWPNLLHLCKQARIPMLLANARLSARSAAGYARFPHLAHSMLRCFHYLAIQTHDEAQRFMQLGALPERIRITGNIKFDQPTPMDLSTKQAELRTLWGARPIWLAASTHKGEDELVLKTFAKLKDVFANLLLVLVPRHPERFTEVRKLCEQAGYQVQTASKQTSCNDATDIFLGDVMGQLPYYYSAVDLAFIGGSLIPIGGHNSLEAANCGLVTVTGPYVFNFKAVNQLLKEAGALFEVPNVEGLTTTVLNLLRDGKLRQAAGQRALAVMSENRGSLETHVNLVAELLHS